MAGNTKKAKASSGSEAVSPTTDAGALDEPAASVRRPPANRPGKGDGPEGEGARDADEAASETCHNLAVARRGEEAAARYLEMCGYRILERNWTCTYGEADIICENPEADTLVFVEVKTRTNIARGMPEESVTPKKRSRYEKIAASYIRYYDKTEIRVRFDVFSILVSGESRALMRHYVNAFGKA